VKNANATVSSSEIWHSWVEWAELRKFRIGTNVELSDWLEGVGGFTKKDHVQMADGKRPRGWEGIRLRGRLEMPDVGPEPPPHKEYPYRH